MPKRRAIRNAQRERAITSASGNSASPTAQPSARAASPAADTPADTAAAAAKPTAICPRLAIDVVSTLSAWCRGL